MVMLFLAAAALASSTAPAFRQQPCADQRLAQLARCGSIVVPEDRQHPDGRKIALNVIVLPATGTGPKLPPLFDIDGGPGLHVTKNVAFYASDGAAYRQNRDIVLVDQRGTGGSNLLRCPALSTPEMDYQPLFPAAAVRGCRTALEKTANLTRYGTEEAVADLDAARQALGHERVDLFGLSYGSMVALRYMARHPQRVRAAVLMGVAPASATPPKGHAAAGDRALKLLFTRCRQDAACNAAFNPPEDVARVRSQLRSIPDAPSEEIFFEKLRTLMYQPATSRLIPFILARAAAGDLAPFYAATRTRDPARYYAEGMFFSVVCSEGMGLMDVAAARAEARTTMLGDYRLRRQQEACAEWPSAAPPRDFLAPVRSDAPVLLLSGELDPVTPPTWADDVTRTLPNARHVVIPGSGHLFDGMSGVDTCLDPLILSFLKTGNAKALDTSCVAAMKPPPFKTSASEGSPR